MKQTRTRPPLQVHTGVKHLHFRIQVQDPGGGFCSEAPVCSHGKCHCHREVWCFRIHSFQILKLSEIKLPLAASSVSHLSLIYLRSVPPSPRCTGSLTGPTGDHWGPAQGSLDPAVHPGLGGLLVSPPRVHLPTCRAPEAVVPTGSTQWLLPTYIYASTAPEARDLESRRPQGRALQGLQGTTVCPSPNSR